MAESKEATVGYGMLDATGRMIAMDAVLSEWLGDQSLLSLLPDLTTLIAAEPRSEQTRLMARGGGAADAVVELTPLLGTESWLLLRIQIARASHAAEHRDVVTGLPDRRSLEMHRSRWQADSNGNLPHALLFLDLDDFKQINDAFGHAIGDKVLSVLAARWRKSLRDCDMIARYGGDEFVVLLAGIRSDADARPIIDRLKRITSEFIQVDDLTLQVGVTVGVALAENTAIPLEELLLAADKAMYAAKRQVS